MGEKLSNVGSESVGRAIAKELPDEGKYVHMHSEIGSDPGHFQVINGKREHVGDTEQRHGTAEHEWRLAIRT
jgi:hypothetical protein